MDFDAGIVKARFEQVVSNRSFRRGRFDEISYFGPSFISRS
jgi:hypothetical protein